MTRLLKPLAGFGRTEVPFFFDGPYETLQTMADAENNVELKRKAEDNEDGGGDGEDDEWVGPMPSEAVQTKKRKGVHLPFSLFFCIHVCHLLCLANHASRVPANSDMFRFSPVLEFERVYLDNLPSAAMYERSYMHRDIITHIVCSK